MPQGVAPLPPGAGVGWLRLAEGLRTRLPAGEIDGVWVFRTMRSGPRELGTAVVSRVEGDRRRIYTARYALTVKGRERGAFEWDMKEVGSGPLAALEELLALVPARGVDTDPPLPIEVGLWFSEPGRESAPAA